MKMNMKNRSHIYKINRPRPRHGHKYRKYKKCLSMMMLIYIIKQHLKQHLKLMQYYEKLSNTEAGLSAVAYEKSVYIVYLQHT